MDIQISNIEIRIGETKLNLTIDSARALYNELKRLFGDSGQYVYPWWGGSSSTVTLTNNPLLSLTNEATTTQQVSSS